MNTQIPKGWRQVTLRSACEPTRIWNPLREPRDEFWYVDVSAVSRESLAIQAPQRVKAAQAPSRARKIIQAADTIFATVRPTLRRIAFVQAKFDNQIASTAFCIVRANRKEAVPRFLYYALQTNSLNEEVAKLQSGASYPAVNDKDVLNQTIALPTPPEQEKIAAVLLQIQRAIELESKLVAAARELKQSTMQQLFAHGTRNEPTKETDIGLMPKGWHPTALRQLTVSSAFGPRFSSDKYTANGKVVTLRTTDIDEDGKIDFQKAPPADLNPEDWRDHLLQKHDCVVTRSGTCGIVAVFDEHPKPVLPGAFLIRVRLNDRLLPEFFRYVANSASGRQRMDQLAQGAIQKNISSTRLLTYLVPLPPPEEQTEIVNLLRTIDRKISVHERKRAALAELFQTLLHQLMAAHIRVDKLDIDTREVAALNPTTV